MLTRINHTKIQKNISRSTWVTKPDATALTSCPGQLVGQKIPVAVTHVGREMQKASAKCRCTAGLIGRTRLASHCQMANGWPAAKASQY